MFGCFLDLEDARCQLTRRLGGDVPLELVPHEADEDADLEPFYDEVVLVKVVGR